ncbi:MAG: tryptophan 7-halogenase [Cellvibrio sp.]|uniref:tryptophan 7-halogenase n=1 Tax=Cellvibrio sp. TaxID=1965322 RepID=UPI0031A34930
MQKIKKIIVVGADEIALLVAATLSFNLRHVEIVLVDSKNKSTGALVESSMENVGAFFSLAGIDIKHFVANTGATLKLGNQFHNWAGAGHQFTHCFGDYGVAFGGVEFHQTIIRLMKEGAYKNIADYSLVAEAVKSGKGLPLLYRAEEGLPQVAVGLHFAIPAFVQYLVSHLQRLGVKRIAEGIVNVNLADDGRIASLVTDSGQEITADFYVDCSGSSSQLLGEAMGVDYIGWQDVLRVNRKLCAVESATTAINSLADITATDKGWLKRTRLRDFTVAELFYHSDDYTDKQAQAEIELHLCGKQVNYFKSTQIIPGKRARFWEKNCLAIGESAVSAAQFSHSPLFMAQAAVTRFLDYFPANEPVPELIDEYNRIAHSETDRIYDYHCLHYWLLDNAHPLAIKEEKLLTPELRHKLDVFRASGRLVKYESDNVESSQWQSLLLGMNVWPERYDPIIGNLSSAQLHQTSELLIERIRQVVSALPPQEYIL